MFAKSATAVALALPLMVSGSATVQVSPNASVQQNTQAFTAYGSSADRTVRVVKRSYERAYKGSGLRIKEKPSTMTVVEEQLDLEKFVDEMEAWSDLSRSIAEESFEAQASAVRG